MLKKLLVALIASAFALGAYAQAPKSDTTKAEPATPAEPKGQTGVATEKAKPATPAKPAKKPATKTAKAKATKDDAKDSRKDASKADDKKDAKAK